MTTVLVNVALGCAQFYISITFAIDSDVHLQHRFIATADVPIFSADY